LVKPAFSGWGSCPSVPVNLVNRCSTSRWTAQTISPFIALPKEHLFLKPKVTKQAAERRGFSLNYKSEPTWLTYSCLLKLGEILMADLAKLRPRDMIDIQSFIFVTGDSNYE
jgi:hypothetical protein